MRMNTIGSAFLKIFFPFVIQLIQYKGHCSYHDNLIKVVRYVDVCGMLGKVFYYMCLNLEIHLLLQKMRLNIC